MVICHPLLRDEDLLTPIDHEVASLQPDSRVSLHSHRKRTEFSLLGKKLSLAVSSSGEPAGAVTSLSYAFWDMVRGSRILTTLTTTDGLLGGTLVSRGEISVGDLTSLLLYTAYVGSGLQMLT